MLVLSLLPLCSEAGVNPRNGNFYIAFTDIQMVSENSEMAMTRSYNSRNTRSGWFGVGWGSVLETKLKVMPDKSAVIIENGNGELVFFHHADKRQNSDVAKAVNTIVAVARKKDKLNKVAVEKLTQELMENEEERFYAAEKYQVHSELPMNLMLSSDEEICSSSLARIKTGFMRQNGCGKTDEFDLKGNLVRHTQSDGDFLSHYSVKMKNGRPQEIVNHQGKSMRLKWAATGHVMKITASNGDTSAYEYDDKHNLVVSKVEAFPSDISVHHYDYDNNHNLTRVIYPDGLSHLITYSDNSLTTSITEPTGERTLLEYQSSVSDPNNYSTRVRVIAADGTETVKTYGFEEITSPHGERHLKGYTINGAQCSNYVLDDKGRVKAKKELTGDIRTYNYHPILNKVTEVRQNEKLIVQYKYDDAGNLTQANDESGLIIDFEYDDAKHIARMYTTNPDASHDDLKFKYNSSGKPVEITQADVGTITVEYDEKGEVSKVDSDAGMLMALKVTKVFQNMLTIVRLGNI